MKKLNDQMIIGVDHGYGNIKTANHCFKTGILGYDSEPLFTGDMLTYNGRYYLIGEGHKEFIAEKIKDEDYYLLTLVAIAKELKDAELTEANIVLAAGLPLTWTSGQKREFAAYLGKNKEVDFNYKKTDYHITIDDVRIYPQGYAAIAEFAASMKGVNLVADIGNGTMNVLYMVNGRPQSGKMYTEKFGTYQCTLAIREMFMQKTHDDKTNILLLDACRSGLSFSKDISSPGLAEISAGNGTLIAFATAPNTSALCSSSETTNSFYTRRLIEHIDHPNLKVEEMFKLVRKDVIKDTCGQQVPWESTSLNHNFYFNTLSKDEINERIYQDIRNNYSAETFIYLSQHFDYTISDIMRIYQQQKSEKPGGIYFKDEESFEQFISGQILSLGFEFLNFRWMYRGIPVLMGDLRHNHTAKLSW